LYQQRPTAEQGNLFQREWFEVLNVLPNENFKHDIFIDGAYTKKTNNDPTAIMSVKHNQNRMVVTDSSAYRLELFELLEEFDKYAERVNFNKSIGVVYIEPKASGKSIRSMLSKKGFNCVELSNKVVALGKYSRAEDSTPTIHGGKVQILKGTWNNSFVDEVVSFPNGKHDDQLDNLCYAVNQYFIKPPKRGIKRRN
jgi:predicted phage terminase large subunit-like protein